MSLHPLSRIDPSHVDGSLDLRGWRVMARDGASLGTVAELIVDVDSGKPVYLDIHPDGREVGPAGECWIRVPYRHAALRKETRSIVLSDLATLGFGTATVGSPVERHAATPHVQLQHPSPP
jgi:hypothetical protein